MLLWYIMSHCYNIRWHSTIAGSKCDRSLCCDTQVLLSEGKGREEGWKERREDEKKNKLLLYKNQCY